MNDNCRKSERRNLLPKAQSKPQLLLLAWHFQESSLQFFCTISWVVSYSSLIVRFVCFSSQNSLPFECLWKIRFLLYRFYKSNCMPLRDPHCTNLDRHCCIYGNLLGKKTLAKEKYIIQLNSELFINITKDITVLHPPMICMKYCLLMNTTWKRNI